eukprot:354314-Chlamydomonas_euryale.AAC.16
MPTWPQACRESPCAGAVSCSHDTGGHIPDFELGALLHPLPTIRQDGQQDGNGVGLPVKHAVQAVDRHPLAVVRREPVVCA